MRSHRSQKSNYGGPERTPLRTARKVGLTKAPTNDNAMELDDGNAKYDPEIKKKMMEEAKADKEKF
jgi:hypothetical protein